MPYFPRLSVTDANKIHDEYLFKMERKVNKKEKKKEKQKIQMKHKQNKMKKTGKKSMKEDLLVLFKLKKTNNT